MEIRPIDPRSDRRWETGPTHDYRVVFWRQPAAAGRPDIPPERVMWSAYEHDVLGAADVIDVIEWADQEARSRECMYTLHAKVDSGERPGLVWLAGVDPTVWSSPNFELQRPANVTPAVGGTRPYCPT
jgi:hypothetical protein